MVWVSLCWLDAAMLITLRIEDKGGVAANISTVLLLLISRATNRHRYSGVTSSPLLVRTHLVLSILPPVSLTCVLGTFLYALSRLK